ncbi:hypothetical protein BSZ39_01215 [Bowdeniella nasicola]|uniref:Galactosyl transferase GMA12/MNN10 family protein n=1 Tax=Bowdeniella nasicola TaxID=208480 RepID=A0A1Q5Q5F9_9ACTO|nr:hypothetical protein [Bowdeniella nasicola]OKL55023.1 hypothetical protein BSZ39_01215 [Bowdeniella nasicola]
MTEHPDTPRWLIASGGDEIRLRSYINHRIYAHVHGFDYRLECGVSQGIRNKFDYKLSIIRRLLPTCDWLVWIDDDAFFTDFDATNLRDLLQRAEREDKFLVIAEGAVEPNGWWSNINTGVFLLRNDARGHQLVDLMSESRLDAVRAWWNEERDGLFTNGDQDQMWWALNTHGLIDDTIIVDHHLLNSRGHYYDDSLSNAFVMHFCGHRDKPLGIARFADRFGIGHELVPEHLLDEYGVSVRSPMTATEYRARALRLAMIGQAKKYGKPLIRQIRAYQERKANS